MTGPPVDHAGLEVLTRDECDRLLATTVVGRIAFVADGEPVVFPVTYRLHRGSIVFRTTVGAKLEAAGRDAPVAFEIDGWDESAHRGWSVLVKGVASEVEDGEEATELFALGLRPWAEATERRRWVKIRPEEISGRRIV